MSHVPPECFSARQPVAVKLSQFLSCNLSFQPVQHFASPWAAAQQFIQADAASRRGLTQVLALMTDYRGILKKVGLALAAFGLADIALMIYSVTNGQSYSSSFNIFAVVAGVFLFRGSLGTARVVTWFSAFMLAGFIGAIFLLFPFLQPFGLLVAQAKLNPGPTIALWLMALVCLVLLGWTYRQLRTAPVLDALKASGRTTARPKLAFGLGLGLAIFLAVMLNMTLNGAAGDKAVDLARKELGSGYKYATQSIQWGGGRGSAVVAAYNDSEIKYIPVEWSE